MPWPSLLAGTVLIECEGGYPERFLNTAASLGVPLWEVRRREASLWCKASAADYRRLRPAARRACVRMRVRSKRGPLFLMRRYGVRLGPVVGLAVFLVLLQLLSSRIWVLQVEGNTTVSDSAILQALEPLGIRAGARFDEVDLTDVRLTALQQLPSLTWLSVNQSGSTVTVQVRERTETPPLTENTPANLVAACDGIVLHIDAVVGQAMVHPGDAVRRGDLLISGVMDSKVGPQLKHAAGSVIARTAHTLTVTVPLTETVTLPGEEIVRPGLSLFGYTVPLYASVPLPDGGTVVTENRAVIANGIPLPIGLSVTRYRYDRIDTVIHTSEQAQQLARERLAVAEAELRKILTVEECSVTINTDETAVTLTAVYRGTQELATERPIGK